jgi:hypothetical protein
MEEKARAAEEKARAAEEKAAAMEHKAKEAQAAMDKNLEQYKKIQEELDELEPTIDRELEEAHQQNEKEKEEYKRDLYSRSNEVLKKASKERNELKKQVASLQALLAAGQQTAQSPTIPDPRHPVTQDEHDRKHNVDGNGPKGSVGAGNMHLGRHHRSDSPQANGVGQDVSESAYASEVMRLAGQSPAFAPTGMNRSDMPYSHPMPGPHLQRSRQDLDDDEDNDEGKKNHEGETEEET